MKNKFRYRTNFVRTLLLLLLSTHFAAGSSAQPPIRVVIAGLNHDHVHGILSRYNEGIVDIVGIAELDKALQAKYSKLYQIPDSLFSTDLKKLIEQKKPAAVLGYNAVGKHLGIVEICAPLGISVMVEKPLAAT